MPSFLRLYLYRVFLDVCWFMLCIQRFENDARDHKETLSEMGCRGRTWHCPSLLNFGRRKHHWPVVVDCKKCLSSYQLASHGLLNHSPLGVQGVPLLFSTDQWWWALLTRNVLYKNAWTQHIVATFHKLNHLCLCPSMPIYAHLCPEHCWPWQPGNHHHAPRVLVLHQWRWRSCL